MDEVISLERVREARAERKTFEQRWLENAAIAAQRPLAKRISRRYFAYELAFDSDDMEQEALIAAWRALQRFSGKHGVGLDFFVGMIIQRRLKSLVSAAKAEHRMGHSRKLRAASSGAEDEISALDRIASNDPSPEERLELLTELRRLQVIVREQLSPAERQALLASIAGSPITSKRMDNALQRARKRLGSPDGSRVCPDCGHTWERHGPKWSTWIKPPGTCSVRGCACETPHLLAAA